MEDICIRMKRNPQKLVEKVAANGIYFLLAPNALITVFNTLKQRIKL